MKRSIALILIGVFALGACRWSTSWSKTEMSAIRRIELPKGSTFSVEGGEGDAVRCSVTLPDGHPHAGTYTTTSPQLHGQLQDAMQFMERPGGKAWIEVDRENVIQTVTSQVTMQ